MVLLKHIYNPHDVWRIHLCDMFCLLNELVLQFLDRHRVCLGSSSHMTGISIPVTEGFRKEFLDCDFLL